MSYASVAAQNIPPPSEQPQPDISLLNTSPPSHPNLADDTAKVNIVAPEFKVHPRTHTSEADRIVEEDTEAVPIPDPVVNLVPTTPHNKQSQNDKQSKADVAKTNHLVALISQFLMRPRVAGGLIGIVNIGILASVGRTFYIRPQLRRDMSAISSAIAASVALISIEGFLAEKYLQTSQGQGEARKVKKEDISIFQKLHEYIMRPRVLGGLLGFVNAAVLGGVGYLSYVNWDKTWDRRLVSSIFLGVFALWGGEGVLADKFSK